MTSSTVVRFPVLFSSMMFPLLCRLLYVPVSMLVCNLLSSLLQSFQEWQVSVSQQYIFLDLLVHRILIDIIIVIFVIVTVFD